MASLHGSPTEDSGELLAPEDAGMTDLRMASWMAERKRRSERRRRAGWIALAVVFAAGATALWLRPTDPLQYIRDECLSHHGIPVDERGGDGKVLAIRCDFLRRLP